MIMSEALARAERVAYANEHPYAWVITRDRAAELAGTESSSAVGVCGPGNAPDDLLALAKAGWGVRFRLLDGGDLDEYNYDFPGAVSKGDELYGVVYEGVLVDPEGEWSFGPLDDYGRPNDGCISIQLYDEGRGWVWV